MYPPSRLSSTTIHLKVELVDANGDGAVSFREFVSAVQADPIMLTALGMSLEQQSVNLLPVKSRGIGCVSRGIGAALGVDASGGVGADDSVRASRDLEQTLLPGETKPNECCCCVVM